MNNAVLNFDQFTDKAVEKNGLVSRADLAKSRKVLQLNPELSLLDVIVRYKLISPGHSKLITRKYQEYREKNIISEIEPAEHISSMENEPGNSPLQKTEAGEERKTSLFEDGRSSITVENLLTPQQQAVSRSTVKRKPSSGELGPLLLQARKAGATDFFINVNSPPIIRKNGRLIQLREQKIEADKTEALLFSVLNEEQQKSLRREQVLETCLVLDGHRYRACFVRQQNGWDGSFRVIPADIPEFEELGLPLEVAQLAEYREGMVLITGPGGSGKSTTLASFIHMLNQSRSEHIITLEDPIEYVFRSEASHISQRQVGLHTQSYSHALRAALREDPDIIVVGELRDRETVSLAVTAAETGHLVFATLHTTGAAQTVHRLLDLFPPAQRNQIRAQISDSLKGIVCQRLIPGIKDSGLKLATEVMFNISSIANLIREDKIFQIPNMIQINHKRGMRLLDESIQKLLAAGAIGHREAYFYANNKKLFEESATILEKECIRERVHAAN